MSSPVVSCGLPFYNAASTLASAIHSIINQDFADWELILVDDGSTDGSVEIARSFADPRIRVLSDGQRRGISARLNQAIDAARGRYFCRMDGDDLAFRRRFSAQVAALDADPELSLVATNVVIFHPPDRVLGVLPVAVTHEAICARPFMGFYMPHPTWMGRIEWFRAGRYDSRADGAEDQHLLFRTHRRSRFACLPEPLLAYREYARDLNKLWKRRRIFATVNAKVALAAGRPGEAALIVCAGLAKAAGDFVNVRLGLAWARHPLVAPSPAVVAEFAALVREPTDVSASGRHA